MRKKQSAKKAVKEVKEVVEVVEVKEPVVLDINNPAHGNLTHEELQSL